jgi:hypothetical protein
VQLAQERDRARPILGAEERDRARRAEQERRLVGGHPEIGSEERGLHLDRASERDQRDEIHAESVAERDGAGNSRRDEEIVTAS